MKNFSFSGLFLVLLTITACNTAPPPSTAETPPPNPYADIERKILFFQQDAEAPALQVQVLDRGEVKFEYTKGVRSVDSAKEVTAKDKYPLGLTTETLNAVLIGQLVDLKIISWDTPLKDIAPRDMPMDPGHRNTTVGMILSQQAGFTEPQNLKLKQLWPELYKIKSTKEARRKLVRGILLAPPKFTPGTKTQPTLSSSVILGWLIEEKTNFPWEEFVRTKILNPVSMDSCGFGAAASVPTPALPDPDQPWGHQIKDKKVVAVKPGALPDFPAATHPGTGLHCNMEDWGKFLRIFSEGFFAESTLLSQKTFEYLLKNTDSTTLTPSGFVRLERVWAKGPAFAMSSVHPTSHAFVAIAPRKDRLILIMTNLGGKPAEKMAAQIVPLLTEIP